MLVSNLTSPRTGNAVANQFVVYFGNGQVFQSYTTIVAAKIEGVVYLTPDWEYSKTTMKYVKEFLNTTATAKTIRERIAEGQYKLAESETIHSLLVA